MLFKTLGLATAALMVASISNAEELNPMEFNKKELNGRSNYVGLAIINSDMADIAFTTRKDNTSDSRTGKTAGFDDPDGFVATIGDDYGYVRIETEVAYRETDVKTLTGVNNLAYTNVSGAIDIGTAMINVAFEYSIDPGEVAGSGDSGFSITPYIQAGGGAFGGVGNINFTTASESVQESVDNGMFILPAIQGGAGITIGMPMGVELYGQYSEMLAYTYNTRDTNDVHIKTVTGGLRINFQNNFLTHF